MKIRYLANGSIRNVRDSVGSALIRFGIASEVIAQQDGSAVNPVEDAKELEAVEISPRTGKPKRQYRRRDMVAES